MKGKRKNRKIGDIIRILVLLIALSVLLYPTVSNYLYEKNSSTIVSEYNNTMDRLSQEEIEEIFQNASNYNDKLTKNSYGFADPFSEKVCENSEYESILNMSGTGIMGYIQIPKIDVELPIYHGTAEKVLQVGVGHINTSSFPVGGKTTHAILTGHRGLPSKKLFTDLDQIKENNIFYIKILGETLAYQVDQIMTVLPEEIDSLRIVDGQDYVTLVTCTPYGINTHRLLIRGYRIPYEDAIKKETDHIDHGLKIPFEVKVLLAGLGVLGLIGIICSISSKMKKSKNNRRKRNEKKDVQRQRKI